MALALLLVAPLGGQAPRLGALGVALRLGQPLFLEALGPRLAFGLPARGLGLRDLGAALLGRLLLGPPDCRTRGLLLGAALVLRFLRGAARGEARLLGDSDDLARDLGALPLRGACLRQEPRRAVRVPALLGELSLPELL